MQVSYARKRKALEDENAKLKKLLAETMLAPRMEKEQLSLRDKGARSVRRAPFPTRTIAPDT
jgi:hypothetical protein